MGLFLKKSDLLIIILLGLTPLTWLRPGYIIAKGDYFPLWLNPQRTLSHDIYLWSQQDIGNPNTMGSFILYEIIWLFLRSLGASVEFVQILFEVFFFMGAGLSMFYLSKTVYPELSSASIISSIFYMFNFFVLRSRLNMGFEWTYMFIPLLMSLLIKIIDATQDKTKTVNKNIVYFGIISTITFSFASINPANILIIVLILGITFLYYIIASKNRMNLLRITKLIVFSALLNLWWTFPILNYYLGSPSQLSPEVNVIAWSWTHQRASFLNLFWLNGDWSWRPEYVPYIDSYLNPILIGLTFIPFFLAATALLFKTKRSYFNAYLMLIILTLLFLAKGLHEPLSGLNLLLYNYIPGMTMFREPTLKFTMALMPFLALLIGFGGHYIANISIGKYKPTKLTKTMIVTFIILTFVMSTYPFLTNPIETITPQLPFFSYIKIPIYWYEAADWLNNGTGNYKVLMMPPDDFYAMPYTWGYYGAEYLPARLIQTPIVLTYYQPYKVNLEVSNTLRQFHNAIKYNKTVEFKALLDLLNIKYILQRNDIQHNFTGRNIMPPKEIQAFLTQQSYIHLTQKFGHLDVYEYDQPKPYLYIVSPTMLTQITVKVENVSLPRRSWNFTTQTDIQEWQNATQTSVWQISYTITQDDNSLKAELWNSTWGWKTINSPLLPAQYGDTYQIQADIKGQNACQVHMKMAEYDANRNIFAATYVAFVHDGTFNWTHQTFNFEPTNQTTKYLQIQVWHGHETDKPFPNTLWVDNVKINGYTIQLTTTGLNLIFQNTSQNQPATILDYTKVNPTKITATINATEPFILAISEALDQSWTAYVNGKQHKPIPLYLGLKGFNITQTGQLEIVIEYEPQRWFSYGSIISATTFLACLTYLTYSYTKNKAILKRIKTTLKRNKSKTEPETQQVTKAQNQKTEN